MPLSKVTSVFLQQNKEKQQYISIYTDIGTDICQYVSTVRMFIVPSAKHLQLLGKTIPCIQQDRRCYTMLSSARAYNIYRL